MSSNRLQRPGSSATNPRVASSARIVMPAPTPRVLPKVSSAVKTSSSARSNKGWTCTTCGLPVSRESVAQNSSQLVDGRLYCLYCLQKSHARAHKIRQAKVRSLVTASALAVMVAGYLGYAWMCRRAERQRERDEFATIAGQVSSLLAGNHYVAARRQLTELETRLSQNANLSSEQSNQELLQTQSNATHGWLLSHFDASNPKEEAAIEKLLGFCPGADNDTGRILGVRCTENRMAVTAVAPAMTKAASADDPACPSTSNQARATDEDTYAAACSFILMLAAQFPDAVEFEVKWQSAEDNREVGTYRVPRGQLDKIGDHLLTSLEKFNIKAPPEAPDQAPPPPEPPASSDNAP